MNLSDDWSKDSLLEELLDLCKTEFGLDQGKDFASYQHDPIGFGEQVLGESFTDEVRALM